MSFIMPALALTVASWPHPQHLRPLCRSPSLVECIYPVRSLICFNKRYTFSKYVYAPRVEYDKQPHAVPAVPVGISFAIRPDESRAANSNSNSNSNQSLLGVTKSWAQPVCRCRCYCCCCCR